MVFLTPPSPSRSTSEMTLSLALQYRISYAFSSKRFCRSQPNVPCVLMNPYQNNLCLLKKYGGPVLHLRCFALAYMFVFIIMFKRCLNFMQHISTGNIVQFPFETNPDFLYAGKTSRSFDKALQMKHCVHV